MQVLRAATTKDKPTSLMKRMMPMRSQLDMLSVMHIFITWGNRYLIQTFLAALSSKLMAAIVLKGTKCTSLAKTTKDSATKVVTREKSWVVQQQNRA
jgi:hypothetical protein